MVIERVKKKERTPLQILQHRYWADLGTCARTLANLRAMPFDQGKYEAIEYVVRVQKILKLDYEDTRARIKAELEQLKAEG